MSINVLAMCLAAAFFVEGESNATHILNDYVEEIGEVYGHRVVFDLGRRVQDWGMRMQDWDGIEIDQLYVEECNL